MIRSEIPALATLPTPDADAPVPVGEHGLLLRARLYRARPEASRRGTVLLFAGGNTSGETFLVPECGLTVFLQAHGWDVWLGEWRASPHVLGTLRDRPLPLGRGFAEERAVFNLDTAAEQDVVTLVRYVAARMPRGDRLAILGHCLGGAITSIALSRGCLQGFHVASFVFTTMSLIYETPWDGWVKAEDFLLERCLATDPGLRWIDPHRPTDWPATLQEAYAAWPAAWLSGDASPEGQLRRALTFMFGSPYAIDSLHPTLRGRVLGELFGPIHVGIYLHVGQNVRRGYCARFGEPDIVDRPRFGAGPCGDLDSKHFEGQRVTLIGGSENRLWHRDSLDLMYEWLRSTVSEGHFEKHVLSGVGMQEMYWGRNPRPVYELIERSL